MIEAVLQRRGSGRQDSIVWGLLFLSAAAWFVATALLAPLVGDTDVFIFKDAGCSLALGQGFTSMALPGSPDMERHLFASHAPGLPMLFGLTASLFGCSAGTNAFFSLTIGVLGTFAVAAILLPRLTPPYKLGCALLFGLAMPAGFTVPSSDRPEALGLAGFAVVCLLARGGRRPFAAAFAAGMVVLCHPFGGILSGFTAWCLSVGPCSWRELPTRWLSLLRLAVAQVALYLVPLLLVLTVYAVLDPTAAARFGGHAFGNGSGAGAVFGRGYLQWLLSALFSSGPYSLALALSSGLVALLVLGSTVFQMLRGEKDGIFPLLVFAFVAATLMFPGQNNYMAWSRSALCLLLAVGTGPVAAGISRRPILPLIVAIVCCANLPFLMLNTVIRAESGESYRLGLEEARSFAASLGGEGVVLVPESAYFLYKPQFRDVVDSDFIASFADLPPIRGLVTCAYGVLIGERPEILPAYADRLELVGHIGDHVIPQLFGKRISHREWGMSCDRYAPLQGSDRANRNPA